MKWFLLVCSAVLVMMLLFAADAWAQCPGGNCPTSRAVIRVPVAVNVVPAAPAIVTAAPRVGIAGRVANLSSRVKEGIESRRDFRHERRANRR